MERFYDRVKEIKELDAIERQSKSSACFTVLVGRRRIGKTELLKKFLKTKKGAYLFTSRMSESMLCLQWQKELELSVGLKLFGHVNSFAELFEQIMLYSKRERFTLVIDEFQDLNFINSGIFSQMQNIWDAHKSSSKINLIVCGSVYSLMAKIFEGQKEALFGRLTHKIILKPFEPSALKEILFDANPNYTPEDLLCLYMLSGGVAKYVSLLIDAKATSKKKMIDYATGSSSPFLVDGKEILVNEMGRDYGIYFSILHLISRGMTTQSEIDSIILKNTGAYLKRLDTVFGIIKPIKPLFSKTESRNTRWQIVDNYLRFYFRFVFANQNLIELGQYDSLKEIVLRDYETFSGVALERYFAAKINEESQLTNIGGWWDKKSNNEIDIIAVNSIKKKCFVYEVKRQAKKLDLNELARKAEIFKAYIPDYGIKLQGLSMADM